MDLSPSDPSLAVLHAPIATTSDASSSQERHVSAARFPSEEVVAQASSVVIATLDDMLGINVDPDLPLMQVGIDSVSAIELTRLLSKRVGTLLP